MIKSNNSINTEDLKPQLLEKLQEMEDLLNEELIITSGYRGPDHPIEAAKTKPGTHSLGLAVDIASVGGTKTLEIVRAAIACGFNRIGISRKSNFVHIDIADISHGKVRSIWTY